MIKFNSIAAAGICLALFIPAASMAQIKKTGNAYQMRLKFRSGEVRKYTMVTSITGLPASATGGGGAGGLKLTGTLEEKVLSVTGNKASMQVSTGAMTMANGQPIGQPQTQTITVDEFGNTSGGQAGGYGVHLPKAPVKVGGTWSQQVNMPGMAGGGKATATYKFNGLKRVGKKTVADLSFSISSAGMLKGGAGHAYLRPEDSGLVSMNMKMTMSNPQGGSDLTTIVSISPAK